MRTIGILALGLFASALVVPPVARADENATAEFDCDRDTYVNGFYLEQYWNGGARLYGRGAKWNENSALFDWDMQVIQDWIDLQAAPAGYYPVFELSVMPTGAISGDNIVQVNTLSSITDWAEGDATVQSNFNWTEGTLAGTFLYAQTAWSGTLQPDVANSIPWTRTTDGAAVTDFYDLVPDFINAAPLELSVADGDQYVSVELDYALTQDLLTNPNNRGLFLTNGANGPTANWEMYFHEETNAARGPARLSVRFSNAPLEYLWQGGTGNWSVPANWLPPTGPAPDGTALFRTGSGGTDVVTLDSNPTIANVRVDGTQDFEWTGGTLTVTDTFTFASDFTGAQDFYGQIAGPGRLRVEKGRLDLLAANSFAGGAYVANGARLHLHSAGALGTGPVELHGVLYTNADGCLSS
ncbi:MAG TPA: hypothetical protein VFJ30_01215, partial [Phycisphaerae bacterium]|nr:hypothetical protein [Phycisphaerae bacterium]